MTPSAGTPDRDRLASVATAAVMASLDPLGKGARRPGPAVVVLAS
ncbi:hypothetical protein [Georgenia sunbinii]